MLLPPPVLAFLDIGSQEMLLILIVALLLFGGRLPDVARTVGRTVGQLRRTAQNLTQDLRRDMYEPPDPGSLSPRSVRPSRPPLSVPQPAGGEKPPDPAPIGPRIETSEDYVAREVGSGQDATQILPAKPADPPAPPENGGKAEGA
ncbi:MAG: twin-arginine translocase TatA/TatE family subunit [Planctomycetes bacterium]|nr:twin-arginine translocase TatA/TatE family subunit [Planctomycetota bacterium]